MKCSPLRIRRYVASLLWKPIQTSSSLIVWNLKLFKNKLCTFGVKFDGLSLSFWLCRPSHLFLKIKYRYQNNFLSINPPPPKKNCGKKVNPVSQVWNNLAWNEKLSPCCCSPTTLLHPCVSHTNIGFFSWNWTEVLFQLSFKAASLFSDNTCQAISLSQHHGQLLRA